VINIFSKDKRDRKMGIYIIAEAGINHNGKIEIAKELVDMAKEAGADAVKFQIFKAEEGLSQYAEKAEYQKKNDPEQETQFEMTKKLQLPFEAFFELKRYCEKKEIDFLSTPDGTESLRYLVSLQVPAIKISSTDVTNYRFLNEIAQTGKKLILSTGMSNLGEVERALEILLERGNSEIVLMHCTTDYPTKIQDVNLRAMLTLKNAFGVPVGYSDHTLGFEAAIAAVAMGAEYIEKHITLDENMKGPDHKASMPPDKFKEYVKYIRNTELLMGDGRKRPTTSECMIMKQTRRSILANERIKKGTILEEEMFCYKRPGTGISPYYANILVGRAVKRDIEKEEMILWQDV